MWQAVNKELGVTLKINIVAQADYAVTLPTVVAREDLPDIIYISPTVVIPQLPTFFKSKMADLMASRAQTRWSCGPTGFSRICWTPRASRVRQTDEQPGDGSVPRRGQLWARPVGGARIRPGRAELQPR